MRAILIKIKIKIDLCVFSVCIVINTIMVIYKPNINKFDEQKEIVVVHSPWTRAQHCKIKRNAQSTKNYIMTDVKTVVVLLERQSSFLIIFITFEYFFDNINLLVNNTISEDKIKKSLTWVKLDWQHIINKNICNKIEFHDGSRFV